MKKIRFKHLKTAGLIGIILASPACALSGETVYANPPAPHAGTLPVISSFYRYYPAPPKITEAVKRIYANNDIVAMQILDDIYKRSGNSLAEPVLSKVFYDQGNGGGCRKLNIDSNILTCGYAQNYIFYAQQQPTGEQQRPVYARGICSVWFLFKYGTNGLETNPIGIEGSASCIPVKTDQPQFETGILVGDE